MIITRGRKEIVNDSCLEPVILKCKDSLLSLVFRFEFSMLSNSPFKVELESARISNHFARRFLVVLIPLLSFKHGGVVNTSPLLPASIAQSKPRSPVWGLREGP